MLMRFADWAFRDRRDGRVVVAQWPNLWLWIVIAAWVVAMAVGTATPVGHAAGIVGTVFLGVWAADELLRGVNPWRRCLGAAVLIGTALRSAL